MTLAQCFHNIHAAYLYPSFLCDFQEANMSEIAPVLIQLLQGAVDLSIAGNKSLLDEITAHQIGVEVRFQVRVVQGLILVVGVLAIGISKVEVVRLLACVFLSEK